MGGWVEGNSAPWNYICFAYSSMRRRHLRDEAVSGASMFSPDSRSTANATAAEHANLGSCGTQVFTDLVLFQPSRDAGMDSNTAWRVAMIAPSLLPDLRSVFQVAPLGHADSEASRDNGQEQESGRDHVRLRGGAEGPARGGDGLPVLGMLRQREGHEQPGGHAFQDLLPDEGGRRRASGRVLRGQEPLG